MGAFIFIVICILALVYSSKHINPADIGKIILTVILVGIGIALIAVGGLGFPFLFAVAKPLYKMWYKD